MAIYNNIAHNIKTEKTIKFLHRGWPKNIDSLLRWNIILPLYIKSGQCPMTWKIGLNNAK